MKFTIVVIALGSVLLTGCYDGSINSTSSSASDQSIAIVDGVVPTEAEKSKLLAAKEADGSGLSYSIDQLFEILHYEQQSLS